jgi:hypothetical protein
MKHYLLAFILIVMITACKQDEQDNKNLSSQRLQQAQEHTNDFYDDAGGHALISVDSILISGEVSEPVTIQKSTLPRHSVLFKDTRFSDEGGRFVGAYQYHGYSLYDILNTVKLEKANADDYSPIIDLYIIVEDASGNTAVFSWGEVFYPNNKHQIIIADSVNPILPSKVDDKWPLPKTAQLIAGHDLYTERSLSQPVKITIKSIPGYFPSIPEDMPLYSPGIELLSAGDSLTFISEIPESLPLLHYKNTFYGRGRGIHGITDFYGVSLKSLIKKHYGLTADRLRHGLFVISAADGYRAAFSYSEIMNRNDQSEVILNDRNAGTEGGRYRLFVSADFFSDRAIKSVNTIDLKMTN